MLLQHKHVAVIGAGPVGLTIARLLQQQGVAVTVYERDRDAGARIWGGTLDLHPDTGQKVMQQAGLLTQYLTLARPMGRTLTDAQAQVIQTIPPQTGNPEINRNVLRTLLLNSLTRDTVVWDHTCTGLEALDGQWQLHFARQPAALADVVIGANGGMSAIRKVVTGAMPEYTGTFIVQGEVPGAETACPDFYRLCNGTILMASGDGTLLVANPHNNGVLTYSVLFAAPADRVTGHQAMFGDVDRTRSWLSGRLAGWHACYRELVRATTAFWGLPTRKLPLDTAWHAHRPLPVTLIGDAAHLMPPFAGKGVNTGLTDALILSENLTGGRFMTIEEAIRDYGQQMRVYAAAAQQESAQNELAMRDPAFSFRQLLMKTGND